MRKYRRREAQSRIIMLLSIETGIQGNIFDFFFGAAYPFDQVRICSRHWFNALGLTQKESRCTDFAFTLVRKIFEHCRRHREPGTHLKNILGRLSRQNKKVGARKDKAKEKTKKGSFGKGSCQRGEPCRRLGKVPDPNRKIQPSPQPEEVCLRGNVREATRILGESERH